MENNPLTERWIIAAELGGILQIVSFIFLFRAGSSSGGPVQQITVVGGTILFVPLVFAMITIAVWQDIQAIEQYNAVEINGLNWITAVVFLPVLGVAGYVWKYSQQPHYRGIAGRLVAYKRGDEPEIIANEKATANNPKNIRGADESTSDTSLRHTNKNKISDNLNFGNGVTNEMPDLRIHEQIASNNSTEIFRAILPEENITVVQKSPKQDATITQSVVDSFIHEATTWEKIDDHDHIVSVYGWGGTPYPWLVLEDMQGGDFREVIENHDIETTIDLLSQVCEGVYHGHERGVYHFDLKPSNILLEHHGDTAKVTDWGSARVFIDDEYSSQELTPAYTSPELVNNKSNSDPSPQTDIFQMGILAYESLTGVHPFRQDSTNECIESIKKTTPRPPSDIEPSLTPEIDETIMKALRKAPEDRHSTLLQFSSELTDQTRLITTH